MPPKVNGRKSHEVCYFPTKNQSHLHFHNLIYQKASMNFPLFSRVITQDKSAGDVESIKPRLERSEAAVFLPELCDPGDGLRSRSIWTAATLRTSWMSPFRMSMRQRTWRRCASDASMLGFIRWAGGFWRASIRWRWIGEHEFTVDLVRTYDSQTWI